MIVNLSNDDEDMIQRALTALATVDDHPDYDTIGNLSDRLNRARIQSDIASEED